MAVTAATPKVKAIQPAQNHYYYPYSRKATKPTKLARNRVFAKPFS
jgi:hypothetical protein